MNGNSRKIRITKWIDWHSKHPAALAALLGILLTLPSLWVGLQSDDVVHRALITDQLVYTSPEEPSWNHLYTFYDGNPQRVQGLIDKGLSLWWTSGKMKANFWRPLSELSHRLDYQLWPDAPWLMHLHNIFLYGGVILLFGVALHRLGAPPAYVGLASMLYAIDYNHAITVSWLANRNSLMATVFSLAALICHMRWRQEQWRPGMWLGPLFLLLGLLSAEFAIAIGGYLLAYTLFMDRSTWPDRLRALLPYALITIAWRLLYNYLGFGAEGSGGYIDPVREPLRFFSSLGDRVAVLLLGQWGVLPADLWSSTDSPFRRFHLAIAFLLLPILFWLLTPLLKKYATARFWCLGMLLAILPVAAAPPGSRLLPLVGLGAMALLAQLLLDWRQKTLPVTSIPVRWIRNTALSIFAITHLVISPLLLPLGSWFILSSLTATTYDVASQLPLKQEDSWRSVVLINPPMASHGMLITQIRHLNGLPNGAHTWLLSSANAGIAASKVDAYQLRLTSRDGLYFPDEGALYRSPGSPLRIGEQIRLDGMTVIVQDLTADNRARVADFRFDLPLTDPRWLFLWYEKGKGFQPLQLDSLVRN